MITYSETERNTIWNRAVLAERQAAKTKETTMEASVTPVVREEFSIAVAAQASNITEHLNALVDTFNAEHAALAGALKSRFQEYARRREYARKLRITKLENRQLRAQIAKPVEPVAPVLDETTDSEAAELRKGLELVRKALENAGIMDGSLVERVQKLAADRDDIARNREMWRKRAETSAASYRKLSAKMPKELQDTSAMVEVKS
jgi:hypothetical protein